MKNKKVFYVFFSLVALSLLTPVWVFKDLLFPYVTSKAFYFRILIELALPFYVFLASASPSLRPRFKQPLNILMLSFLAINFVTAFTGINTGRSLWGNFERMGGAYYLAHLVLLYFYILMIGQAGGRWLKLFLQLFLFSSLIVTVNGLSGKLGGPILVQDPSLPGRISSTLGNPIYVGSYLIIPMAVALFLGFEEPGRLRKLLYFLAGLLTLLCVYYSGTRGALVGILAGGFLASLVFLFAAASRRIKMYGLGLIAVFSLSAAALFFNSDRLPAGSVAQRVFHLRDSNTEARLIQWRVAWQGFKVYPLAGVGPENYYYIANKYFNPEIYQYDRSWFDKPHNYLLEILVTNGIFGLLCYVLILAAGAWSCFRAFKKGYFGAAGFAALIFAFLAYQIQNLTVFDTIPASMSFYCFMGFMGYLAFEARRDDGRENRGAKEKKSPVLAGRNLALPSGAAAVAAILSVYGIFVTNVIAASAGKNVNYGFAYASIDEDRALGYFRAAAENPANFDQTETSSRFSMFGTQAAQTAQTPQEKTKALEILDEAINYQNSVLEQNGTYAASWESLATNYLAKAFLQGQGYDYRAEDAVNKALEFSPNRLEAQQQMVQILLIKNQTGQATDELNRLIKTFPTDAGLKAQAGLIEQALGQSGQALEWFKLAYGQKYIFRSFREAQLLADYFDKNGDAESEISLLEQVAQVDASDLDLAVRLAGLYWKTGQREKASGLAGRVLQVAPEMKPQLGEILAATSTR